MVFLTQLASAVGKSRAYPPGHPVLTAAIEVLIRHVEAMLAQEPLLTLGAGRDRLLIGGRESDPGHAMLRDLADRIHRHQVAAIQIRPGVDSRELADLLGALATDSWRTGTPLGLERQDRLFQRWPHVSVEPLPLGRLELDEAPGSARAASHGGQFWRGLVNAALVEAQEAGGEAGSATDPPDGVQVAQTIRRHRDDAAYCRGVVSWLVQMDDQVAPGEGVDAAHQRVAELLGALDGETLGQLMTLGATPEERRAIVFRGARVLPIRTVLDLLHAAAGSEQGLSTSLVRILTKLANHAEAVGGAAIPGAEEVVRNSVRHLVTSWDPAAEENQPHRQLLDLLIKPGEAEGVATGKVAPGTLRMSRMGVELGVDAPAVSAAVGLLRDSGDFGTLLDLLERGEAGGRAPGPVWRELSDPVFVAERILDEEEDLEAVARVLDRMENAAAGPLLDALEASDSASRRKWILQRLEPIVPRLGPELVERLRGKPWFVIRNLLGLIATMPARPAGFSAMPYLTHENARVRREAFKLVAAEPANRDAAILEAVRDPDPGIALLALAAAGEQCPPELPSRLLDLLRDTYRDPDLRVHAVRLLGKQPGTAGRDWLIGRVVTERWFLLFRRRKLAERSPEMLAALATLAGSYARDPAVREVLRLARASGDAAIRAAAAREAE